MLSQQYASNLNALSSSATEHSTASWILEAGRQLTNADGVSGNERAVSNRPR